MDFVVNPPQHWPLFAVATSDENAGSTYSVLYAACGATGNAIVAAGVMFLPNSFKDAASSSAWGSTACSLACSGIVLSMAPCNEKSRRGGLYALIGVLYQYSHLPKSMM